MITRARLLHYELPFRAPVRAGDGVHESRSGLLLALDDDSGTTGWGEAAPLPGLSRDTYPQAEAGLRGLVEGLSDRPREAAALLPTVAAWRSRIPSAAAALDTALLDLVSRRQNISLAQHLSGGREPASRVPVNALIAAETAADVAAAATRAHGEGFRSFKLKLGNRPLEEDVARVAALRDAVGPDASVRLDANAAWEPAEAIRALARLAAYDIEYIEDPVAGVDGLIQVAAATQIPVAADALLSRSVDPMAAVAAAAADVFVLKPGALGGPTITTAVATTAAIRGLPAVVTSLLESAVGLAAAVHLAAALPHQGRASGLATSYLFAENVAEPPPIVDGAIVVPSGPGLGVAPSELSAADLAEGGAG